MYDVYHRVRDIVQFLEKWENFTKILAQDGVEIDFVFVKEVESHICEWAILRGYAVFEDGINRCIEERIHKRFREGEEEFAFVKKRLQGRKFVSDLRENSLRSVFNTFIGKDRFDSLIDDQDWKMLQSLVELRHSLAHEGAASSPPGINDVRRFIFSGWKVMVVIGNNIIQKRLCQSGL